MLWVATIKRLGQITSEMPGELDEVRPFKFPAFATKFECWPKHGCVDPSCAYFRQSKPMTNGDDPERVSGIDDIPGNITAYEGAELDRLHDDLVSELEIGLEFDQFSRRGDRPKPSP